MAIFPEFTKESMAQTSRRYHIAPQSHKIVFKGYHTNFQQSILPQLNTLPGRNSYLQNSRSDPKSSMQEVTTRYIACWHVKAPSNQSTIPLVSVQIVSHPPSYEINIMCIENLRNPTQSIVRKCKDDAKPYLTISRSILLYMQPKWHFDYV